MNSLRSRGVICILVLMSAAAWAHDEKEKVQSNIARIDLTEHVADTARCAVIAAIAAVGGWALEKTVHVSHATVAALEAVGISFAHKAVAGIEFAGLKHFSGACNRSFGNVFTSFSQLGETLARGREQEAQIRKGMCASGARGLEAWSKCMVACGTGKGQNEWASVVQTHLLKDFPEKNAVAVALAFEELAAAVRSFCFNEACANGPAYGRYDDINQCRTHLRNRWKGIDGTLGPGNQKITMPAPTTLEWETEWQRRLGLLVPTKSLVLLADLKDQASLKNPLRGKHVPLEFEPKLAPFPLMDFTKGKKGLFPNLNAFDPVFKKGTLLPGAKKLLLPDGKLMDPEFKHVFGETGNDDFDETPLKLRPFGSPDEVKSRFGNFPFKKADIRVPASAGKIIYYGDAGLTAAPYDEHRASFATAERKQLETLLSPKGELTRTMPSPLSGFEFAKQKDGKILVFGVDDKGKVWRTQQREGGLEGRWDSWSALPGAGGVSSISSAYDRDGRVHLFFLRDGGITHRIQSSANGPWNDEADLGGGNATQIASGVNAEGNLVLYRLQENGAVDRRDQRPGESPPWTPWIGVGFSRY